LLRQLFGGQKIAPALKALVNSEPEDRCDLLIECSGMKLDRIFSFIETNRGQVGKEIRLIPAVTVNLPAASVTELCKFQQIQRIWSDSRVTVMSETAVPGLRGALAEEYDYTGKGVTVAIIDTGIYPHEDLTNPTNRIIAWNDLIDNILFPYDNHGHGTHVAGIIGGNGRASEGKYKGIAPEARLVGIKALDQSGTGRLSDLILALEWCLCNLATLKIKIINLSLGTSAQADCREDPLCRATAAAWRNGLIVCSTAGRVGSDYELCNNPGINPAIVTVGNADFEKTLTCEDVRLSRMKGRQPFTPVYVRDAGMHGKGREARRSFDYFTVPDIVAPASDVVSLKAEGGYCTYSGASMATPMVAGGIALIVEKWPACQPDQVKSLLTKKAGDSGLGVNLQGAGTLNLEKILGTAHKKNSSRNATQNLLSRALKTVLGLLGIDSGGGSTTNDLLMLALTLFNQFLAKKPSDTLEK
jgi:serine protease AprX